MHKYISLMTILLLVFPMTWVFAQGVTSNSMERGSANPVDNNTPMNSPIEGDAPPKNANIPVQGDIISYKKHTNTPCTVLIDPDTQQPTGTYVDTNGKKYIGYRDCMNKVSPNANPMGAGR